MSSEGKFPSTDPPRIDLDTILGSSPQSLSAVDANDEDDDEEVVSDVIEIFSDDEEEAPAVPGSAANPFVLTPTPTPNKKRTRGTPTSPESPTAQRSRKTPRLLERSEEERAAAADKRALQVLTATLRVDTSDACMLAMARRGMIALLAADDAVLAEQEVQPRPRPGQAPSEHIEYYTVAEEAQMREWEQRLSLRDSFLDAAMAVLRELDPDAPYVVMRRSYELYVDPFQKPPKIDHVYPAHKCGLCDSRASHPVSLWCNHMFCFVCARLRLNKSWECPKRDCRQPQRRPPWRRLELEEEIEQVYVGFTDFTQVKYEWNDVRFPGGARSA
ncbi:hypothetical protein C8F01DRAFT_1254869 [Mycena amicta]|nr:hypothetical protein C8F01DRAFT_1254869 [Mycena amicta]